MIFIYSASNSVFNQGGKNKDKLLLLNFINNYSIISFLHMIKILEIKYKFYLNINKILIKILLLFSRDFELIFSFLKKNKFFKFFYIKFFFNLFFNLLLESMIHFIKREDLFFFLA